MRGTRPSVDRALARSTTRASPVMCHAIRPRQSANSQCVGAECEAPPSWSSEHSSSSTFLADFGARVTLERLYQTSTDQELPSTTGRVLEDPLGLLPILHVQVDDKPASSNKNYQKKNTERSPDYFANVGDAIRTLREDIPDLFNRELNYSIYRDDVVFKDPRNTFAGIKNYKLIFWSLRFHGKIFFSNLYVEVKRIWQPTDDVIKMRWTVHGIPRVPWEAEGLFDGISTYKLDSHGRVYEHCVDNVLLRDPPMLTNPPMLAGLNLVPGTPQQPVAGSWCEGDAAGSAAQHVMGTAHLQQQLPAHMGASGTAASHDIAHGSSLLRRMWWRQAADSHSSPAAPSHAHPYAPAHSQPHTPTSSSQPCPPALGVQVAAAADAAAPASDLGSLVSRFSWVRMYVALMASLAVVRAVTGSQRDGVPPEHSTPLTA